MQYNLLKVWGQILVNQVCVWVSQSVDEQRMRSSLYCVPLSARKVLFQAVHLSLP